MGVQSNVWNGRTQAYISPQVVTCSNFQSNYQATLTRTAVVFFFVDVSLFSVVAKLDQPVYDKHEILRVRCYGVLSINSKFLIMLYLQTKWLFSRHLFKLHIIGIMLTCWNKQIYKWGFSAKIFVYHRMWYCLLVVKMLSVSINDKTYLWTHR